MRQPHSCHTTTSRSRNIRDPVALTPTAPAIKAAALGALEYAPTPAILLLPAHTVLRALVAPDPTPTAPAIKVAALVAAPTPTALATKAAVAPPEAMVTTASNRVAV